MKIRKALIMFVMLFAGIVIVFTGCGGGGNNTNTASQSSSSNTSGTGTGTQSSSAAPADSNNNNNAGSTNNSSTAPAGSNNTNSQSGSTAPAGNNNTSSQSSGAASGNNTNSQSSSAASGNNNSTDTPSASGSSSPPATPVNSGNNNIVDITGDWVIGAFIDLTGTYYTPDEYSASMGIDTSAVTAAYTFNEDGSAVMSSIAGEVAGTYEWDGTQLILTLNGQDFIFEYDDVDGKDALLYSDPNTRMSTLLERF